MNHRRIIKWVCSLFSIVFITKHTVDEKTRYTWNNSSRWSDKFQSYANFVELHLLNFFLWIFYESNWISMYIGRHVRRLAIRTIIKCPTFVFRSNFWSEFRCISNGVYSNVKIQRIYWYSAIVWIAFIFLLHFQNGFESFVFPDRNNWRSLKLSIDIKS